MKILFPANYDPSVPLSCIYKITNIKNGKVYIGQTVNYRKRSSDYASSERKKHRVNMYNVITNEGIDNFIMEVICICEPKELDDNEAYYIEKYDSLNPEKGYNLEKYRTIATGNTEESRTAKSIAHTGLKESADTKRKKSNKIYAIKDDDLIICDSAKLFGDYIGKSKDLIKNGLRQPSSINGYRLYYADYNKRLEIEDKMYKKQYIKDRGYIQVLGLINNFEFEGLEAIEEYYNLFTLTYSEEDNTTPVLKELSTD